MSDAVGSIISGATSLVNTGLNALASGLGNKRAFRRAKTMHNIQRQEQLDDMRWNYEMNSPIQQMRLLREAGLNPNMVYGSGNPVVSTSAGGGVGFQNPVSHVGNFDINSFVNNLATMANVKAINQRRLLDAQRTANELLKGQVIGKKMDVDFDKDGLYSKLKKAQIRALKSSSALREQEYEFQKDLKPYGIGNNAPWWIKPAIKGGLQIKDTLKSGVNSFLQFLGF